MGMRKAEEVLGRGDWVHIFPEGTRTRDGRIGPARRGVARLISSCEQPPLGTAAAVLLMAGNATFDTSLCCSPKVAVQCLQGRHGRFERLKLALSCLVAAALLLLHACLR